MMVSISTWTATPERSPMGEHSFEGDLLRLLVAEIWFAISMKAARELFGRSYFALGMGERLALEQVVAATVGAMYSEITPALLRPQTKRIAGFQVGKRSEERRGGREWWRRCG